MPPDTQIGVYVRLRISDPFGIGRTYHAVAGKGRDSKKSSSVYGPIGPAKKAAFRFLGLIDRSAFGRLIATPMQTGQVWVRLP